MGMSWHCSYHTHGQRIPSFYNLMTLCSKSVLGVWLALFSLPAFAVAPARFLEIPKPMDDFTIASYNKMISSQDLGKAELVKRYVERGLAYASLFRFPEAIKDYGLAVGLDPNNVTAFYQRGIAQARLENYPSAYEDLDTAIRLDPGFLPALLQRAHLHFLKGKYEQAAAGFAHYLEKKPGDLYRVLWLYLSERYQKKSPSGVPNFIRGINLTQWPGAILELYLGEISLDDFVKALKPQLTGWDKEHRCEAYYYLGQYHLLRGEQKQALAYFQQARKTEAKTLIEYEFSLVYLHRWKAG